MAQSNQQLAELKNRLEIPLVVRGILKENEEFDGDTAYAISEVMSNLNPEDALLCAAFSMKEIAGFEAISTNDLTFLHMECDRIIERYSARDDLSNDNPELWAETQGDMMDEVAEDLEGFLDLSGLCQLSFEMTAPTIAQMLDIFAVQLQSQLLVVDEVIEMHADINNALSPYPAEYKDNVVAFPSL